MDKIVINGESVYFDNTKLLENLTLRNLCETIKEGCEYYNFLIFHPSIEEDVDKDLKSSNQSVFDFWFCNGDADEEAKFIAIGFKKGRGALPLWLIESNEWCLRIERK